MNEEKKRILSLVEEGKITASEALTLLELLEKDQQHKNEKEKEMINDLSTVVILDEEEKKEQKSERKVASAKEMILGFVDNIFTKVKELDLNFAKHTEISHILHDQSTTFDDVNIEVANGNVEIVSWDQEGIKIECQAKVFRTEDQSEARKTLLDAITFDVKDSKLYYMVGEKWVRVHSKIFLPTAHYHKVRLLLFNGTVTATNLEMDHLKLKTANGKILLQQITSKEAEIETANGNIDLEDIQINKLDCETINGSVKSKGVFEHAEMETFNGDIIVDHFNNEAKNLNAKSASGSIKISVPDNVIVAGEAKSNLGGIQVDVHGMKLTDEKKEVIQKIMKFENEQVASLKVYANSRTGSVAIRQN